MNYASNTNDIQQIMQAVILQNGQKYNQANRGILSTYASSPILSYNPNNFNGAMDTYRNALNRQAEYKLADITAATGNEYHSSGAKIARMNAMLEANQQINDIANQRLARERQLQGQDIQTALARQHNAANAQIGSILQFATTPTQDTVVTDPFDVAGLMGGVGSLIGGLGSAGLALK